MLIDFNNEPTKIVTVEEFENIMNSVGLNWYGWDNFSVRDREMFEEKTDMSFSPMGDGKVKLHDDNFIWEE
jgi:hypothetical protein